MAEEKDAAALEEERLMKSLSSARSRAHNAFGATHAVKVGHTLHKPQTAVKPMVATPIAKPAAAPGQIPEWKRRQMEHEEARKREEEEAARKKHEMMKEVYQSTPAPSAAATNVTQPRPAPTPAPEPAEAPKTTVISRSILDEEAEERARKEEERMMRRTGVLEREAGMKQPQGDYFTLVKTQSATKNDNRK